MELRGLGKGGVGIGEWVVLGYNFRCSWGELGEGGGGWGGWVEGGLGERRLQV